MLAPFAIPFFSRRRRLMRQYMSLRHAYLGILLAAKKGRVNEPDHGYSGSMFDGVAVWREDLARPLPSLEAEMRHVIDWFQSR
jgi:hypothetical protein